MTTFIDHVRCGECDTGLTLAAESVMVQRYRRQPWLDHFWVQCDICAAHKLYWPTPRQVRLAGQLKCRTVTDDAAPADVAACFARWKGLPVASGRHTTAFGIPVNELAFLLSMLAATSRWTPTAGPAPSYLPPHWAN